MALGPWIAAAHGVPSRRLRIKAFTRAGLAFPLVAFITWPTRKPNVCCLPARYCLTASAFDVDDLPHRRLDGRVVVDPRETLGRDDDVSGTAARQHLLEDFLGRRDS